METLSRMCCGALWQVLNHLSPAQLSTGDVAGATSMLASSLTLARSLNDLPTQVCHSTTPFGLCFPNIVALAWACSSTVQDQLPACGGMYEAAAQVAVHACMFCPGRSSHADGCLKHDNAWLSRLIVNVCAQQGLA